MPAYRGTGRKALDPLLLVGSFFAVSQICGVAPRVKLYHSYPAMDRSIKMIRQSEQVFEPSCMTFRELRGEKEVTMVLQKRKKKRKKKRRRKKNKKNKKEELKKYNNIWRGGGGGGQLYAAFRLS
jgi:hypothetical protein